MGFLGDLLHNHHQADPVRGTALVAAVNDWLLETRTPYTLRATLVVEADGVPKTTVEHTELVNANTGTHLDRWPEQGDRIPVTIDRQDPTRVVIEWDEMPGRLAAQREAAARRTEARKEELLAEAYGGRGTPASPDAPRHDAPAGPAGQQHDSWRVRHKICTRCGRTNPSHFTFCGSCGRSLPAEPVD